MKTESLSLWLYCLDLCDQLDAATTIADAVANKQLDERDTRRAPVVLGSLTASVAQKLRILARVARGETDPSCLVHERTAASPPMDARDIDVRLSFSPRQRAEFLRRELARAERELKDRKSNRRRAR